MFFFHSKFMQMVSFHQRQRKKDEKKIIIECLHIRESNAGSELDKYALDS